MNYMCPHCGALSPARGSLIPNHNYPPLTRQLCPGSQQNPRHPESDGRQLWNGEANPNFYRTVAARAAEPKESE